MSEEILRLSADQVREMLKQEEYRKLLSAIDSYSSLEPITSRTSPSNTIQAVRELIHSHSEDDKIAGTRMTILNARTRISKDPGIEPPLTKELVAQLAEALKTNQPLLGGIEEILDVANVLGTDISEEHRRLNEESNGTVGKRFFDEMEALAIRVKKGDGQVEPQLFRLAFAGEALFSTPEYKSYDKLELAQIALRNARRKGFSPAWKRLVPPTYDEISERAASLSGRELGKLPAGQVLALIEERKLKVGQLVDMVIDDEVRNLVRKQAQSVINSLIREHIEHPSITSIIWELLVALEGEGIAKSNLADVALVIVEMQVKKAEKYRENISTEYLSLNFRSTNYDWLNSIRPTGFFKLDKRISKEEANRDRLYFSNLEELLVSIYHGIVEQITK